MKYYSKEETIKRHREMWNWIADQVESGEIDLNTFDDIHELKIKAIQTLHSEDENNIRNDCYLCDYASRQLYYYFITPNSICGVRDRCFCYYCPLGHDKNPNPSKCLNGLYGDVCDFFCFEKFDEFIKLAREIANLPEANFNDAELNCKKGE